MSGDASRQRVVLVSGGSGDIGQAICRRLHRDGWTVAIGCVSRRRADLLAADLAATGRAAVVVPLDLADLAATERDIVAFLSTVGTVDAVVFNGGTSHFARLRDGIDPVDEMRVNFLGPALVVRHCLPLMVAADGGTFIAVTSEAAKVGDVGHAAYGASKAALHGFLAEVAREHGAGGVRAASVSPGPIDTQMLRGDFGEGEKAERAIQKLSALIPAGRLGHPAEVAAAVALLLDTSSLSGSHLSVGGGVVMHVPDAQAPR